MSSKNAPGGQTLTLTRSIQAPAAQIYTAFTNKDWLCNWFCDDAHVAAKVGGHLLLLWPPDYRASGEYTILEPDAKIAFTWRGTGEKIDSPVTISINAQGNTTHITLTHSGLAADADLAIYQKEWEAGLDNLKSVLETGADLRITKRTTVGFWPDTLTEAKAQQLGVPTIKGMLVVGFPEGSAAADQLQLNDVVIEIAGQPIQTYGELLALMKKHKPGDEVSVSFYRGGKKRTVTLKLSSYPVPKLPADFVTLGNYYEKRYAELDSGLAAMLAGVSENVAGKKPTAQDWNVKEIIAHLILCERYLQAAIGSYIDAPEISGGYSGNADARLGALIKAYPTTTDLLVELRRSWAETVALLRAFPVKATARKSSLWRTNMQMDGFFGHAGGHIEQLDETLKAVHS